MNQKTVNVIKQNKFISAIILALAVSILGTVYCILFGQRLASTHLEPCTLTAFQGFLALAISIIFIIVKPLRTQPKWFLVPVLLFGFCFLYEFIVGMYPCCVGG